jgi:hypothetical protein
MILQVIDIVDTKQEAGLYNHFKTQLLEVLFGNLPPSYSPINNAQW